MAYKTKYFPKNLTKYEGDPNKINCRSLWERKFCKYLDENKNILKWSFEPLKIPYVSPVDKMVHFYIPDFLIEKRKNNNEVETIMVEIKPEKQTKQPEMGKKKKKTFINESITYEINKQKWTSAKDFCDKHNISFKILTEKDLF
jgi:hypothetical protein